ncbi:MULTISPECIES: PRD domain-containing protein [Virgibacillus]|uniref:PRD domain-containing protein n=1 Tax=Virgibacillus TaxID=84406 RepID=UPI0009E21CA8|nr:MULTISPECIES: PRD domain-containing protein [Virgibacillus]MBS7427344.1 PRD domain-containing protein [Virgibacillus sp. 19R1-5]MED3738762.1 PRD domain-containing protein [Virgibacillus pantothenticus]QTY16603.1 PRD domain-containing protein [Virgibacillus pantothenticus]
MTVKIIKKFNNNVIMSLNDKSQEVILIGNGLGFGVSPGDTINKDKIEKTFVIDNDYNRETVYDFLSDIPKEQLELTKDIIELTENLLKVQLNDYLYLSLSDHLYYAFKRHKSGTDISNPLLNEIQKIYPKEYEAAMLALQLIFESTGTKLAKDEAGFIALHFVNAQQGQITINETMKIPKMIKEILRIIEFHFSIQLDTSSISYDRFITHLKYFIKRSIDSNEEEHNSQTNVMLQSLRMNTPKIYDCVEKISEYMQKTQEVTINEDEKFYLFVYIYKLTTKE